MSLMTHRPLVPGSDAHLAALSGLSPLGRVLYPDLHHRRVVAAIAAARAKVAQTAEDPGAGTSGAFTTRDPLPRSRNGCNTECA